VRSAKNKRDKSLELQLRFIRDGTSESRIPSLDPQTQEVHQMDKYDHKKFTHSPTRERRISPAPAAPPSPKLPPTASGRAVNSAAEVETSTARKSKISRLDPYTASATFEWHAERDGSDKLAVLRFRYYYWYDPEGERPPFGDSALRTKYPEIGDDEWRQLFREAFARGEADFARDRVAEARVALAEYDDPSS
jgi:hypothetical protein